MTDKQISGAIWFPAQRAIRTGLAVLASILISGSAAIATAALVAPQVLDAIRDLMRPEDFAVLAGWVVTLTGVSAAVSRIMAIPQVDAFLKRFGAGSSPAKVDLPDAVQAAKDAAVVGALTAPAMAQVSALEAAAARLGIPIEDVTRETFRDAQEE